MSEPVHLLRLETVDVPFTLRRRPRTTLGITVFPDGTVLVCAPQDAPLEAVDARLRRRGAWILRTRRYFETFRPHTPVRRFVNGETHRFLGRQHRLSIRPQAPTHVGLAGAFLVVGGVELDDGDTVRRRVTAWYGRQARRVFAERLDACLTRFTSAPLEAPALIVRRLTHRWGSMSADGRRLVLNTRLVEAAPREIDYVVTHELCHIVHPHHGPAFFDLLEREMPDWEARKLRLERQLA